MWCVSCSLYIIFMSILFCSSTLPVLFFFSLFINGTLLQESEAAAFIMSRFEEEDVENSGFLPSERLLPILSSADLGLSRVQLNAIMSEARTDDQGFVQYADFAVLAAQMFVKIFDFRVAENNA